MVHEMVHLWQHEHGQPGRRGYHNAEWASAMDLIGLVPSKTGTPGGAKTGQRMRQYVAPGGRFAAAFDLMPPAYYFPWFAAADGAAGSDKNKTQYRCPTCNVNAWAKPGVRLACVSCNALLVACG